MTIGDTVTIPNRQDGLVWEITEILPSGAVSVRRSPHPLERIWGNYETTKQTVNQRGIKYLYCQVVSIDHLEKHEGKKNGRKKF